MWREPKNAGNTPADLLVVGLGNPGSDYAQTRHNIGQVAVEMLAQRHDVTLKRAMGVAHWGHARVRGRVLALGVPGVFMNLSGEAVAPLVRRYAVDDLSKLIVIHDELDLEPGRIQIKCGGGLAGHNGLKSIKAHLKDESFTRIRIGIGRPPGMQRASDYVLRRASTDQRDELQGAIERAADAVEAILQTGIPAAMNTYNNQ